MKKTATALAAGALLALGAAGFALAGGAHSGGHGSTEAEEGHAKIVVGHADAEEGHADAAEGHADAEEGHADAEEGHAAAAGQMPGRGMTPDRIAEEREWQHRPIMAQTPLTGRVVVLYKVPVRSKKARDRCRPPVFITKRRKKTFSVHRYFYVFIIFKEPLQNRGQFF